MGNKKIKQSYIDKGAFTIDKSDLEEIHQEIRRRDTLDYIEDDENADGFYLVQKNLRTIY